MDTDQDSHVAHNQLFFGMSGVLGDGEWTLDDFDNSPASEYLSWTDFGADISSITTPGPASQVPHSHSLPIISSPAHPWDHVHPARRSLPGGFNDLNACQTHISDEWGLHSTQYLSPSSLAGYNTTHSDDGNDAMVDGSMFSIQDVGDHSIDFLHPSSSSPSWSTGIPIPIALSRTESVQSYQTAPEESPEAVIESFEPFEIGSTSPDLAVVQYKINDSTKRLAPETGPGGKVPRGRKGSLKPDQRKAAAKMREIKACDTCRRRKAKCDAGIPCKACINYYKCDLVHHPCRGKQLQVLADTLLRGKAFPKARMWEQYLDPAFVRNPATFLLHLTFGFGQPFEWEAQLVSPRGNAHYRNSSEFVHHHVVYPWPTNHEQVSQKITSRDLVFPAVLAIRDRQSLLTAIDQHITVLLDRLENFRDFPYYVSPFQALRPIYVYYLDMADFPDPKPKNLLRTALKLLILVHINGDTKIFPTRTSQKVIAHSFGPQTDQSKVTACFIRGQLGPIFTQLAHTYMRDVLTQLELHCLSKKCQHFPLVISTFAVLFMAVESIHYHAAKDPYHARYDDPPTVAATSTSATGSGTSRPAFNPQSLEECEGAMALLEFYQRCFSGCHRERFLAAVTEQKTPTVQHSVHQQQQQDPHDGGSAVISGLKEAVERAKLYLVERSTAKLSTQGGNITVFFDRLLARLFLLQP